ncbi:MAG: ABC transporter permease [Myxococcales bacterium]|nr:ABC transporter permease [Myxococcales bacterium]
MNTWRTLAVALQALTRNLTRSLLTVLGVIIGVAAVIAMVSLGEGAKAKVAKTFESMGTDMLTVFSGSSFAGGARGGAGSQPTLTWDDLGAIRAMENVSMAAPQLSSQGQLVSPTANWNSRVTGTTPEWFHIRNWSLASGRFFEAADEAGGRAVAVLGKTVSDALFGEGVDPVGQTVRVNRVPFQVVGLLASKGSSAFGMDNDDVIVVPATTFNRRISGGLSKYLQGVIVVQASSGQTDAVRADLSALLRTRHKLRDDAEDDFAVRDLADIAQAQQQSAQTITSLLAGVALVSLIVGGIGIMNIMLVSVTERTREIGLRMSVGATPSNVLMQFLLEAMTLSVLGGLIGIALGLGAGQVMAMKFGFPVAVRPDVVVLAVVVSAAVGIGFGLYPARKASLLEPIAALRYE